MSGAPMTVRSKLNRTPFGSTTLAVGLGVCLSMLAVTPPALAQDDAHAGVGVRFTPRFVVGRTLQYRHTQSNAIQSGEQRQESQLTATFDLSMAQASPEGAKLDLTFRTLSLSMSAGDARAAYDSEDPDAAPELAPQPLIDTVEAVVGGAAVLMVDEQGRVLSIDGLDQIAPDAPLRDALAPLISEAALSRTITRLFNPSPEHDAKRTGDTWEARERTPLDSTAALAVTMTYRLEHVDEELARVSALGDATVTFDDARPADAPRPDLTEHHIEARVDWDRTLQVVRRYAGVFTIRLQEDRPSGEARSLAVTQRTMTQLIGLAVAD